MMARAALFGVIALNVGTFIGATVVIVAGLIAFAPAGVYALRSLAT